MLEEIYQFCMDNLNYGWITFFMAVESSFIPFPSEIVVPPAGYMAADPQSNLNAVLVVFFSTMGSLIGALINYGIAYSLGRPVIYKFVNSKIGKICLLSEKSMNKAEKYFNENGAISTFVGRLIPGIRQLISIPAGISKMKLPKFIGYTLLGAGIWNAVLCCIGYFLHSVCTIEDVPTLAKQYGTKISLIIIVVVAIALIIYFLKKKKSKAESNN